MSEVRFFLDTHVLVGWVQQSSEFRAQHRAILENYQELAPFGVSDISLAEIGCLVHSGRIELSLELESWLSRAVAEPLVRRFGISPAVVAEVNRLPDTVPSEPSDRLIVASARLAKATLLTCDGRIIQCGAVPTI